MSLLDKAKKFAAQAKDLAEVGSAHRIPLVDALRSASRRGVTVTSM
jgi:hypothetical protein